MWAMIPMLRQRSNGTCLGISLNLHFWGKTRSSASLKKLKVTITPETLQSTPLIYFYLPAIVCKRLVGFRHAVHVFFLLDCRAATVGRVQQFIRQLVHHAFFPTLAGIAHDPANRQRGAPVWIHFHRYLVVRAANAAGLYFQQRLGVLHGLLEQLQGFIAALGLQVLHGFIENSL